MQNNVLHDLMQITTHQISQCRFFTSRQPHSDWLYCFKKKSVQKKRYRRGAKHSDSTQLKSRRRTQKGLLILIGSFQYTNILHCPRFTDLIVAQHSYCIVLYSWWTNNSVYCFLWGYMPCSRSEHYLQCLSWLSQPPRESQPTRHKPNHSARFAAWRTVVTSMWHWGFFIPVPHVGPLWLSTPNWCHHSQSAVWVTSAGCFIFSLLVPLQLPDWRELNCRLMGRITTRFRK